MIPPHIVSDLPHNPLANYFGIPNLVQPSLAPIPEI